MKSGFLIFAVSVLIVLAGVIGYFSYMSNKQSKDLIEDKHNDWLAWCSSQHGEIVHKSGDSESCVVNGNVVGYWSEGTYWGV